MRIDRRIFLAVGALIVGALSFVLFANPLRCDSIDECVALARHVASPAEKSYQRVNDAERAVADKLNTYGVKAVPALVELLNDRNRDVREIAGYALRDIEGIDPKYISDLVRAMKDGDDWIAPAIGRIATDEAARVLAEQLFQSPSTQNQLTYALRLVGERAVPHLVRNARCEVACDDYLSAAASVMDEIRAPDEQAIGLLLENASDMALPLSVRQGNVRLIGAMGPGSNTAEHGLMLLNERRPELSEAIFQALYGIRSPHVNRLLHQKLESEPSVVLLRDIAELGPVARPLGPALVSLFSHEDWDIRVHARRVTGFVGYDDALPELLASLNDEEDWRRTWAAVEALGRLKAESAVPALAQVSKNFWYPPLREAAEKAMRVIRGEERYPEVDPNENFAWHYFSEIYRLSEIDCDISNLEQRTEPRDQKLYEEYASADLKKLNYTFESVGYDVDNESGSIISKRETREQVPGVALKVENGWLLAGDRGEWGGETVFVDRKGHQTILLHENTEDVYKLGDGYIAVTGLAHLSFNRGRLYRLTPRENGAWRVQNWRQLPGAPASSWFVETGELLVNTYGGACVLIDDEGAMRMACGTK